MKSLDRGLRHESLCYADEMVLRPMWGEHGGLHVELSHPRVLACAQAELLLVLSDLGVHLLHRPAAGRGNREPELHRAVHRDVGASAGEGRHEVHRVAGERHALAVRPGVADREHVQRARVHGVEVRHAHDVLEPRGPVAEMRERVVDRALGALRGVEPRELVLVLRPDERVDADAPVAGALGRDRLEVVVRVYRAEAHVLRELGVLVRLEGDLDARDARVLDFSVGYERPHVRAAAVGADDEVDDGPIPVRKRQLPLILPRHMLDRAQRVAPLDAAGGRGIDEDLAQDSAVDLGARGLLRLGGRHPVEERLAGAVGHQDRHALRARVRDECIPDAGGLERRLPCLGVQVERPAQVRAGIELLVALVQRRGDVLPREHVEERETAGAATNDCDARGRHRRLSRRHRGSCSP